MKGGLPFRALADLVTAAPEFQGLGSIIEKELLHYELLHLLDRGGWLVDKLVFQGGTSLRLCHGSSRMSEDLDFSGGPGFSAETMAGLAAYLEDSLPAQARGLAVIVRPPKRPRELPGGDIRVSTWRVDIEIEPRQKHQPKQRIKIDVDNTISYTNHLVAINRNYAELPDYNLAVNVQREEEILANKVVAFSTSLATRSRPRYRDIWDMKWLASSRGAALHIDLLDSKMQEHGVSPSLVNDAAARVDGIVRTPEFTMEMRRFLLPNLAAETLDNPRFMEVLAQGAERILREAARDLDGTKDGDIPSPSPFQSQGNPFGSS